MRIFLIALDVAALVLIVLVWIEIRASRIPPNPML